MTAILRRSLLGLAVLLAVGSCKGNQRTELVVEVGSNLVVPGELDKIDLAVTANGQTQHTPYSLVSDYTLPLYVGIVEATAGAGSIEIVATGYLSGSPIVNETAVLSFVEGQSMLLKLFLAAECRDNPCTDPTKTCTTGGTCVDVARTPSDLTPYKPGAAGSAGGNSGSGGLSSGGGNSGGGGGGSTSSGLGGSGGSDAGVPDASDAQPDVPIGGAGGVGGIGGAGGANGGTGGVPRPGGATSSGGATNLPDAGTDLSTGTPDATTASGQTVALFHFDGTQGSTNLVDSSGWAHTATIFGNPIITTSQSKFGGASLYVNGVGSDHKNYVLADSIAKEFTFSGDFTIDFWLYVVSYTNSWGSFVAVGNSLPTALDWAGTCSGSATQLVVTASWESSGSNWCCLGATPCAGPPLNSWHHVAITRSGSKTREFVDGQAFPSAWDESIMTPIAGGSYLVISGAPCETPGAGDNGDMNGYIDELRVVNGVAVWTSNFTPPTAPYTATNVFPVDAGAPDLPTGTPDVRVAVVDGTGTMAPDSGADVATDSGWIVAADAGSVLTSGATVVGAQIATISAIGEWTFYGVTGDEVVINAVTTSGKLDPTIYLYPPGGGTSVATAGAPYESPTSTPQLVYQLAATGTYSIVIEDHSLTNTGNYNITLLQIPGTGGSISSGQTLSESIVAASAMEAFQFAGNTGDEVTINAVTTSGSLFPSIYLYPPGGGTSVATAGAPYESPTSNPQFVYQLAATGTYSIVIEDHSLTNTGNYNLSLLDIP